MSSTATEPKIIRSQYLAHKGDDLLGQIQKVLCVISARSIVTAGFHPSGEVLMINASTQEAVTWDTKFYEEQIVDDVLWATPELVTGVFVVSEKELIIPEHLFAVSDAELWLQKTFFVEGYEQIAHLHLDRQSAHCVYAYPQGIESLLHNYLERFFIKPISCAHFNNKVVDVLQCCIDQQNFLATLHKGNRLVWHQNFTYQSAEDILYLLIAACDQQGVDIQQHFLSVSTLLPQLHPMQRALKGYFPNLPQKKNSIVDVIAPEWSSTVFLFQQLYPCAS